jgi:hypothetical protein
MPQPFLKFNSNNFNLSFLIDELQISVSKLIEIIIEYQQALDNQGIDDNIYELIYLSEIIDDGILYIYTHHINQLRNKLFCYVANDIIDETFLLVHNLIIFGYDRFTEICLLETANKNYRYRRCSGENSVDLMNKYIENNNKLNQLFNAKRCEKINHWFSI